jgi:hypothetical protein
MSAKTVTYARLERLKTLKMRQSSAEPLAGSRVLEGKMKERFDKIPDVRDGLTREERVVLYILNETQKERGDRNVPTAMLWGRVCEHFYISPEDLSALLARLGARK